MVDPLSNQGRKEQSFIASVLYAEIAGYADLPVFEQIEYTTQMRQLLESTVARSSRVDFLTVDREESVILLFPGDPMDCFALAKQLTEVLTVEENYRDLPLHFGVNLGPVTVSKNELSVPQVSGAGVEDAGRVARAGLLREILISRAFYTVFARISKEHGSLEYREFISDDLDESFAIYQIAHPSESPLTTAVSSPSQLDVLAASPPRPSRWRYAAVSTLVAAGAFALYQNQRPVTPKAVNAPQPAAIAAKVAKGKIQPTELAPVAVVNPTPAPAPSPADHAPEFTDNTAEIVAAVNFHYAIEPFAPAVHENPQIEPSKNVARASVAKPVTVRLAIKPWGEVYVDGKKVGITPPLHKIKIPPGKRQIVVRNGDFLPYRATFDIRPESLLQISHQFDK